jgi:chorismate synthase
VNSFGIKFKFTTFGESHGKAIGCVIDGVPSNVHIDTNFIQDELNRRKPGQNKYSTQRKEDDIVQILSGVFEKEDKNGNTIALSTGTPIAIVIFNKDQKSKDYSNIKDLFRPGHADFTYFHKYGIRDYRGGGRSSARETAARVAAGAIAKLILKELNIQVLSGISCIGDIQCDTKDFDFAKNSEIYSLDPEVEKTIIQLEEWLLLK